MEKVFIQFNVRHTPPRTSSAQVPLRAFVCYLGALREGKQSSPIENALRGQEKQILPKKHRTWNRLRSRASEREEEKVANMSNIAANERKKL